MTTADTQYSLVLMGRYPGKDRLVAHALSQVFGRDDAWGLQVVGVSPVIVLEALTAEQAQLIHQALAEVEEAGSKFEVRHGAVESASKVHWSTPPRLHGHAIAEFCAAGDKTAVSLIVPCPYTGQKIKLTITVQATRLSAENISPTVIAPVAISAPIPVAPSVVPVPVAIHLPSQSSAPSSAPSPISTLISTLPVSAPPIPVPVPATVLHAPQPLRHPTPPMATHTPPAPATHTPAALAPTPPPPELQEALLPPEQFLPVSSKPPVRSQTRSVLARPPSSGIPLPDVPVVHTQVSQALSKPVAPPEAPAPQMQPSLVNAPMDMEVFEQRVSSSGIFQTPELSEHEELPPTASNDGSLCSVFMGKSNNVKAHQLLAELHGISLHEAAKSCQKTLVAVAKNVTISEAMEIRQRFAAINVNARVVKRKQ